MSSARAQLASRAPLAAPQAAVRPTRSTNRRGVLAIGHPPSHDAAVSAHENP